MHKDVVRQTRYMNVCLLFLEKKSDAIAFLLLCNRRQAMSGTKRTNERKYN